MRTTLVLLRLIEYALVGGLNTLNILHLYLSMICCWAVSLYCLIYNGAISVLCYLVLFHLQFVGGAWVHVLDWMPKHAVRILYEYLLNFGLISLDFYLNLWTMREWVCLLLILLHLELVTTSRNYKRLVDATDDLCTVEGSIIIFFKTLMFLNFLWSNSIWFWCGITRRNIRLTHTKSGFNNSRRTTSVLIPLCLFFRWPYCWTYLFIVKLLNTNLALCIRMTICTQLQFLQFYIRILLTHWWYILAWLGIYHLIH